MRLLLQCCLIIGGFLLMMTGAFAQGTAPTSRAERAELRFLEGMIDHHQMALDMANDCLKKAQDETLRTLCQNIITAQSAEIAQMQGWLKDWYGVEYAPMPMDTHSMPGMSMPDPQMMMGMMAGLNQLEGRAYEIAWVESMIDHHDDALHMSERILRQVAHDNLRALATAIIKDQAAEIRLMEGLLVTLSA
jgi:uncharacterized protein (DUF305 family)